MKTHRKVVAPRKNLLETLTADPQLAQQVLVASVHQTLHLTSVFSPDQAEEDLSIELAKTLPPDAPYENQSTFRLSNSSLETLHALPKRRLITPGEPLDTAAEYRLVGELGRGGTGVVYQAHQRAVDREVAVKVLRDELANDPISRQQFLTEATTIGGLDHPNVIAIHEVGTDHSGRLFYSMKRVDGTAWSAVIDRRTAPENLQTLLNVASAIAYAHNRGLIHRDLKPENVMLGPFNEVLVTDWGLAIPYPFPQDSEHSLVSVGGTPAYMAPELAMGDMTAVGPHTDVYLLGAVLFRILTGYPPHFGSTIMECLQAAADNLIRSTEVQGELMDVARRAMASTPDERYANVQEFQLAIESYLQHQESVGLVDRARSLLRRALPGTGYELLGTALSLLQEALELWPQNRRAERMLRETRLLFARRAADQGDLDLAWSFVEITQSQNTEVGERIRQLRDARTAQDAQANHWEKLFAHSPDAVLVTRLEDGVILEANDVLLQLVGSERDAVVGRSVLEINLWESPLRRDQFVRDVLRLGRVDNVEISFYRPDGRRVWALLSARLMESDGQQLVVAHARDNSARKLAEMQLERHRQRLREVQQLARLGTWELDLLDGRVLFGEETLEMLGVSRAPESLEEYLAWIHPEDREVAKKAIDGAITHGAAFQLELRLLRDDGSYNRLISRGQPILEECRTVELFGAFLDVTDHCRNRS